MSMLLKSDMLLVERHALAAAAGLMPRPPRWREREEQTRNLLIMIDYVQCHVLTDHLDPMRAGDVDWLRFVACLNKQATSIHGSTVLNLEADWSWLIELILIEYCHQLKDSWAWGACTLYVDSDVRGRDACFGEHPQDIHLTGPDKGKYELEDKHIRTARALWYKNPDGGKGGKRRMTQLLFNLPHFPRGSKRETLQEGSFAPTEVANAAIFDDSTAIAKWIDGEGGSPDALVRMDDQRGSRIELCPATRLLAITARKGSPSSMRALLERGADVKLFNDDGVTALMVAAEEGQLELVRWLLVAKADPLA
eukprot:4464745-Prymnesium_polylepis.2